MSSIFEFISIPIYLACSKISWNCRINAEYLHDMHNSECLIVQNMTKYSDLCCLHPAKIFQYPIIISNILSYMTLNQTIRKTLAKINPNLFLKWLVLLLEICECKYNAVVMWVIIIMVLPIVVRIAYNLHNHSWMTKMKWIKCTECFVSTKFFPGMFISLVRLCIHATKNQVQVHMNT